MNYRICNIYKKDINEILKLENNTCKYPLTKSELLEYVKNKNLIRLKIIDEYNDILSYIIAYKSKEDYTIIITRMVTDIKYMGIGIENVLIKAIKENKHNIEFCVNEYDLDMQIILKNLGFVATKIIHKYKDNEDAYKMVLENKTNTEVF